MKAAPTSSSRVAQRQQLTPPLPALISCSTDRSAPPELVELRNATLEDGSVDPNNAIIRVFGTETDSDEE